MDMQNSVVIAGRRGEGKVEEVMGDKWWWKENWLGWWAHNTVYRWSVIELCIWNLYNFINQYHPNKFNKKEKMTTTDTHTKKTLMGKNTNMYH